MDKPGRPTSLPKFLYGSAYYPEHWDEPTRKLDPSRMRDAGWNCVRMGEFSWDIFEPKAGHYDFSFYDKVIENLGRHGISTILCTPTAAPPVWLVRRHPEILRWNADNIPLAHGSRQHASHASPLFRDYSRKITAALAQHFKANADVIGWQTDNEMHCHFSEDHSPSAQEAFRDYLSRKYGGDIALLNRTWGNAFWALTYVSFAEIETPRPEKPTHSNPSQVLDYYRFLSHAATLFQRDQVHILRGENPSWFITHNGWFHHLDYAGDFSRDLDFLSYDSYPFFQFDSSTRSAAQAANLDYMRSFSGNFVVMEQQSGPGGQAGYFHDNPEPGEMRRMAYTSIARGADGLLFFRWRTCRFAAEQYWCGVLDHDNVPRRRYRESAIIGKELSRIGNRLLGTSVHLDVGIAGGDFDALEGHQPISHGLPSPKKAGEEIHRYFFERGYAVGFVHPAHDLLGLKIYIIPHFAVFDPAWVFSLHRFVAAGGILIVGARTASRDKNSHVVAETLPASLRPLVGATVQEFGRQNDPQNRTLFLRIGNHRIPTSLWYEILEPDRATKVLATWGNRHLQGQAAITLRPIQKGAVVYVGTYFDHPLLNALLPALKRHVDLVKPQPGFRRGLHIVQRQNAEKVIWFYINEGSSTRRIVPPGNATLDLLTGKPPSKIVSLAPNDVLILEGPKALAPIRQPDHR